MPANLVKNDVELAALDWFQGLGHAILHGPHIAQGDASAERDSFDEVVLAGRLHEELRKLNQAIAFRTLATPHDPAGAGLPKLLSGELRVAQSAAKMRQAV